MIYGFRVDSLPPLFQQRVAEYELAKDGLWRTNAKTIEEARQQTVEIVRICTKERISPASLVALLVPQPKRGVRVTQWKVTTLEERRVAAEARQAAA